MSVARFAFQARCDPIRDIEHLSMRLLGVHRPNGNPSDLHGVIHHSAVRA
jgi:hypothetical protein